MPSSYAPALATPVSAPNGGTGVANNAASTLTISGNFATTFTVSGVTAITLPTSGTLATVAGTSNLIAGDGLGNGEDSGIAPADVTSGLGLANTALQPNGNGSSLEGITGLQISVDGTPAGNFLTKDAGTNGITDSGVSTATFATAAQGATADSALQPEDDISGTGGVNTDITEAIDAVAGISGSFSGVGTATTTFTVTIGQTLGDAGYKVTATPSNVLSAAVFYVNNKTTTTFDVVYLAGLTGTVEFDWHVDK